MTPERLAILSYIRSGLAKDPATGLRRLSIRRAAALAGVSTATVASYASVAPADRRRFQPTEVSKLLRALAEAEVNAV